MTDIIMYVIANFSYPFKGVRHRNLSAEAASVCWQEPVVKWIVQVVNLSHLSLSYYHGISVVLSHKNTLSVSIANYVYFDANTYKETN